MKRISKPRSAALAALVFCWTTPVLAQSSGDATPTSATSANELPAAPSPSPTVEPISPIVPTAAPPPQRATLTPIVPGPPEAAEPAYQLYAETDLPLLGFGLVMASARLFRSQPAYCAPLCDRTTLNALDRTTAGFYDRTWSTSSDIGLVTVMGGAALYLFLDEHPLPALNDAVVITESALTAVAISSLATVAAARPRPFLFGTKAPLDVRNSANASLSFVSSYAAATFAIGVSTYVTARRLHPTMSQMVPALVLITGLVSASFVSFGQVEGGNHFVTDVVAGAVVGSASGILVPALHKTPVRIAPTITGREGGIQVMGMF